MLKINRENLKASHEGPWLLLDMAMLGLLFFNLLWLIFDALFATEFLSQALMAYTPSFAKAYRPIHENFLLVDLVFISVFLSEFVLRWIAAIKRNVYLRWYFFPFIPFVNVRDKD